MNIVIFSRPIRSGKTTGLQAWCAGRTDVGGILMPDIDGKRHFLDIASGTRWPIDHREPGTFLYSERLSSIGKFQYSEQAFALARTTIGFSSTAFSWLLIDEIGKLELEDKGFAPSLSRLLRVPVKPANLLLVVRDSLLEEVRLKFRLKNARVVHSLDGL